MKNLAIFASGSGTNAENIIRFFAGSEEAQVRLVLCNKEGAGVIARAKNLETPVVLFSRQDFYESNRILNLLTSHKIDLIVLAGFLWLVPEKVVQAYPKAILNIHPALLPKYGGKGMYGDRVHQAVLDAGEQESGITIHLIDEEFDQGQNLFQKTCPVYRNDSVESLAQRIHHLEYEWFPKVIKEFLLEHSV